MDSDKKLLIYECVSYNVHREEIWIQRKNYLAGHSGYEVVDLAVGYVRNRLADLVF